MVTMSVFSYHSCYSYRYVYNASENKSHSSDFIITSEYFAWWSYFFPHLSGKYILIYTHKFEKSVVPLVVVVVHT